MRPTQQRKTISEGRRYRCFARDPGISKNAVAAGARQVTWCIRNDHSLVARNGHLERDVFTRNHITLRFRYSARFIAFNRIPLKRTLFNANPKAVTMHYPEFGPSATGLLNVDGTNEIYWETSGNPDGKPALYLHGGPGSGLRSGSYRQHFNPEKYYLVGIDQRGCGRSRPLATENLKDLPSNNTQALIADIEAVRAHLKIASWLVSGVSWGATLSLAYAQSHPDRVSELVLMAVTTTSRAEVDWITEGIGCLFPAEWEAFAQSSNRLSQERIVEAYARRLASSDAVDRSKAVEAWNIWESIHVSLDPNWLPMSARLDEERAAVFATLVTHYWANDGFLLNGSAITDRLSLIQDIPAVLIHGRRDFSSPPMTAWKLHKAWPASRLIIVEEEGHGGPSSKEHMRTALDDFCA